MGTLQVPATILEKNLMFADAALALAGHEATDPEWRGVLEQTARHEVTGDEAIAAIRRHL